MLNPLLPQLDRIARALLPEHERADRNLVARARFGGAAICVLVLLALVRVPMLLSGGQRQQTIALAACAIMALLVPVISRVTGSFVFSAHAIVLLALVPVVSLVHVTGGSGSPALLALLVTPMIAVFLTGARGGIAWSLLVGGVICAYALIDRLGLSPPILFPPESWKLEKSIGAFLLILAVLGLALSYERSRQIAEEDAVRAARQADERVAASETGHRESLQWLSQSFAHEANNTLAYVIGDLANLRDATSSRRAAVPTGEVARLGAERLRHIVHDVQTIADSGARSAGDSVPTDVCRLVDDVVEELLPLLRGLAIEIRPRPPGGPIYAHSIPSDLARCVASSLIAFTPESQIEIDVVGGARPAVVVTAGRDALESRPLATEALRRRLASFGASLVTTSDAKRATLRLELLPADAPAKPAAPAPSKKEPRKLRVLVVDDEALILQVMTRLLSNYDVVTTTSPRIALEELRSGGFDVVFCDFNMPSMRGDVVFASAVDLGFDPAHFIVMSGGDMEEIKSVFGERRQLTLSKPFTRKELEGVIQSARVGETLAPS